MRAINYMKVDYMLSKQRDEDYFAGVCHCGAISGKNNGGWMDVVFLFLSAVYCHNFFHNALRDLSEKEYGILLMLPGTVAERVIGRFLFGLSYIAMAVLFCVAVMGVFSRFGYEIDVMVVGLMLCNMALGIFIVAFEYLICYLFGEGKGNWQYLGNIVRIAPGMGMFFLSMSVLGKMEEETYVVDRMEFLSRQILSVGALALGAAILVMAVFGRDLCEGDREARLCVSHNFISDI